MFPKESRNACLFVLVALFVVISSSTFAFADSKPVMSTGQTLYVPVYSNVYSGPKAHEFLLATMVSIRNTDPKYPITILKADYYDSEGKLVKKHLPSRTRLAPLASTHIYIKEYDTDGGPGANFIVKWESKSLVNEPIIEALSLGLKGGQGISFVSPGKVISEH